MPMIATKCPGCGARLKVPSNAPDDVRCPRCTHELRRPAQEEPPAETPAPTNDPLRLALVGVALAGVASLGSQFPYGKIPAALVGLIGVGLGAMSLLGLERRRWLGRLGVGLNVVAIVFALGSASWSLTSGDPSAAPKTPVAVGDSDLPRPAEWVEADRAVWQHDDVRVAVTSASLVPDPAAKGAKRGKDRLLRIGVTITNVGVARAVEATGWPHGTPPEVTLTADGRDVPRLAGEPPARATLYPGKSAEFALTFSPSPAATELRLTLPAEAFGGTTPARFRIPSRMIAVPR